jgi:hypothetical protein
VEEGHVVLAPSILLLMASHCFLQVSSLSIWELEVTALLWSDPLKSTIP